MSSVEVRCPVNGSKLLARILTQPGVRILRDAGNLVEVACRHCSTERRRDGHPDHVVLHRWNVLGELVETVYDKPAGQTR